MHTKRFSFLSAITAFVLLVSLAMPTVAFAGDEPPTEPTPVATEAAPEEDTPEETSPAEVEVAPPLEETVPVEEAGSEEAAPAEIEIVVEEETIAEVIAVIDETDSVLVDESGEPMAAADVETAELLSGGDPWFEDPSNPGQVIAFQASCAGWVPPAGYSGGTCTSSATPIQDAVTAAPVGGIVHVEAGIFTEQVEINKDLTLQGSSGAIIKSPIVLIESFVTSAVNKPVVYVHGANNVTISGFTIDGDNQGDANYRFMGIGYYNAGGTISNNVVTNVMNSTFSGAQHGNAIYVYNNDGITREVVIDGNTVTDYQKNGITVNGNNVSAEITNNEVYGQGPTAVTAQNGIQIGFGATGEVSGNLVTGNYYTPSSWSAAGILLYDSTGTVVISDNVLADNGVNISVVDNDANPTNMQSSGNDISGGEYGISISDYTTGGGANGTVNGDMIYDNGVGIYTDNPGTVINNSNIYGNSGPGVWYDDWFSLGGTVDGTNNYWGCWLGTGPAGCDVTEGNVDTTPYLTVAHPNADRDADGVADGADNCPLDANHDQANGDYDADGDVCDAYPNDPENERPGQPEPATDTTGAGGLIIPVTGGWSWIGDSSSLQSTGSLIVEVTELDTNSETPLEVYGVSIEHVFAALQLTIPESDALATITASFTTDAPHLVAVVLPDGTQMELPTVCTANADGTYLCVATYTPDGTEGSLAPVIYLHD